MKRRILDQIDKTIQESPGKKNINKPSLDDDNNNNNNIRANST